MNIVQFVLGRAMEEISKSLSEVGIFSLAEPTQLQLPNKSVELSSAIKDIGGRIEDWDNGKDEYYLDFPGRKFEACIIAKDNEVTYCLVDFGYNQCIITISETEVNEMKLNWELPDPIHKKLMRLAYEEILLALPK